MNINNTPAFFLKLIKALKCEICFSGVPWLSVITVLLLTCHHFITNFGYPFLFPVKLLCMDQQFSCSHTFSHIIFSLNTHWSEGIQQQIKILLKIFQKESVPGFEARMFKQAHIMHQSDIKAYIMVTILSDWNMNNFCGMSLKHVSLSTTFLLDDGFMTYVFIKCNTFHCCHYYHHHHHWHFHLLCIFVTFKGILQWSMHNVCS